MGWLEWLLYSGTGFMAAFGVALFNIVFLTWILVEVLTIKTDLKKRKNSLKKASNTTPKGKMEEWNNQRYSKVKKGEWKEETTPPKPYKGRRKSHD